MEEITMTISPEGDVKIEVNGVEGAGCLEATRPLEEALGIEDPERTEKPEMMLTQDVEQEVTMW